MSGEIGASGEIGVSDEARDSMQYRWHSGSDYGVMTRSLARVHRTAIVQSLKNCI